MAKKLFIVTLLLGVLSGCTVTFTPADFAVSGNLRFGIELSSVITEFRPNRGSGAGYQIGDSISFVVRSNQSGYITLSEIDPFGRVDTFGRNIPIAAGTTVIAGPDSRSEFAIASNSVLGLHRVRASFTPSATDISRISYRGIVGEDGWTNTIITEVRPFTIRDIAETSFIIR